MLQIGDSVRGQRASERRERIVTAARKLFCGNGFHSTGVAQIAAESGVKVGQIYRDFASKEDIVAAIVEDDVANFLHCEQLVDAVESRDFDAVRSWIFHLVEPEPLSPEHRLLPEILAESTRNQRISAILHTVEEQVRGSLMTALRAIAPEPEKSGRCRCVAELILTIGMGLNQRRLIAAGVDQCSASGRLRQIIEDELAALVA